MSTDDGFEKSRMKGAMDELMKSEEGRELAAKLRNKLKELNDEYTVLPDEKKKDFLVEFREKFADSFGEIKDSIKSSLGDNPNGEFKLRGDESSSVPPPVAFNSYAPLLFAIFVLVLVFG